MEKSFVHLARAWYAVHTIPGRDFSDDVTISIGNAELAIRWYRIGQTIHPRLEVFDDGWIALAELPELVHMLASYHKSNLTPLELCDQLVGLGFVDSTPTEK